MRLWMIRFGGLSGDQRQLKEQKTADCGGLTVTQADERFARRRVANVIDSVFESS